MPKFQFYIDQKVVTWIRDDYLIEAATYEGAEAKMMEEFRNPTYEQDGIIGYQERIPMEGEEQLISPKDNDGKPTKELIYEDKKVLNRVQTNAS